MFLSFQSETWYGAGSAANYALCLVFIYFYFFYNLELHVVYWDLCSPVLSSSSRVLLLLTR